MYSFFDFQHSVRRFWWKIKVLLGLGQDNLKKKKKICNECEDEEMENLTSRCLYNDHICIVTNMHSMVFGQLIYCYFLYLSLAFSRPLRILESASIQMFFRIRRGFFSFLLFFIFLYFSFSFQAGFLRPLYMYIYIHHKSLGVAVS